MFTIGNCDRWWWWRTTLGYDSSVLHISTCDTYTGVFVIPNQSIIGDKSLQQYQVTLKELDGYLGMKLIPHLDQKMVSYLIYLQISAVQNQYLMFYSLIYSQNCSHYSEDKFIKIQRVKLSVYWLSSVKICVPSMGVKWCLQRSLNWSNILKGNHRIY